MSRISQSSIPPSNKANNIEVSHAPDGMFSIIAKLEATENHIKILESNEPNHFVQSHVHHKEIHRAIFEAFQINNTKPNIKSLKKMHHFRDTAVSMHFSNYNDRLKRKGYFQPVGGLFTEEKTNKDDEIFTWIEAEIEKGSYFHFSEKVLNKISNCDAIISAYSEEDRKNFGKLFERIFIDTLQKLELDYTRTNQTQPVKIIHSKGGVIGAIAVKLLCHEFFVSDTYEINKIFEEIFYEMKKWYSIFEEKGRIFSYYGKACFKLEEKEDAFYLKPVEQG